MKNLLLILLLANILYFLWGWFDEERYKPGVALVNEAQLGPPLTVAETSDTDHLDGIGAVLDSDQASNYLALVGRSCVTIGPFRERDDADAAQTRYAGQGMQTHLRMGRGQYFVGHWVQIRNVPSRDESNRMLRVLKDGGLVDAYPVETEDEGLKISLGLFGNLDSAEKIELQAQSLGFDADIAPRLSEGDVAWVDIALPPGTGAGDIMERYGEDQVKLRDAATCPPD
ncbi:MAG: SPOR domain-containing protein [Woeseiaceae bacterium]|nr:SPOR domain-containing protein [Woeseiaceae bacterium]